MARGSDFQIRRGGGVFGGFIVQNFVRRGYFKRFLGRDFLLKLAKIEKY